MDQSKGKDSQKSNWAKREEELLSFWQENEIFEKSLAKNEGKKHFVFYDGPPFATGLPHYGHLLASVIKDTIPRYRTMKGDYVRRVWGWDCHGLPVETLIEKELGLDHKKDIEEYGIGKFNKAAEQSVLRYDEEWKKMIPRIGRWIDMDRSYKTMDKNYTESIWWAFSELYKKDLIYKGYKSMHICPRCETTLSSSEVAQGYETIKDISVTAKFELIDPVRTDGSGEPTSNGAGDPKTYVLAWTTTPWTLPGNVALAVGEDIAYSKLKVESVKSKDTEFLFVAKDRIEEVLKDVEYEVVEEVKGKDLVGKSYKPPFDYFSKDEQLENRDNGWKIYAGDFVTTESGTGIVHIAPAFGEDDMNLGKKYDLPFVQHVSFDGKFKKEVKDFVGMFVKPKGDHQKTDIEIIKYLAGKNILFAKEKIEHSYPHCWRCDTPLLNYATSSWFVKVTELSDKLVKLNKKVNWIPDSIGEGRFGNWLENARDWSISRTRFWGAPLPVWECEGCGERKIVGSVKDIRENSKKRNNYFIVRHGEADSNTGNIVSSKIGNGHHVTEKGKEQINKAVKKLKSKNIDVIISSPFLRTKETAELIADGLGMKMSDIVFEDNLKEIDTGIFDGKPTADYHAHFSSMMEKLTKTPPEGENLTDVRRRMMNTVIGADKKYEGKNILFVSHEYPLWALTAGVLGVSKEETVRMKEEAGDDFIKNAEVREIDFAHYPHNEDFEIDLHRPYIDEIVLACACGKEARRIPDVFDCWVESGSMPFAQFHHPFENVKEFKNNFPADFIAEGVDQTRGWFYTMLVIAAGLFDKSPYKNVVVNGLILAEDGKKMSKRLKNYPQPTDIVHKYSADALRYYLLSSPVVHGEELRFSEGGVDEVQKKVIGRLLNVLSFYKLYEDRNIEPSASSKNVLDAWIIARLNETIKEVEESLDGYELDRAVRPIGIFIDDLSTWYLRRSRDRFKGEDVVDKKTALATTRFVLRELSKIIAPFMPFLAENVYQEVTEEKESVHMEEWMRGSLFDRFRKKEEPILKEMEEVRSVVSLGLEARASAGIKVRQPLQMLKVNTGEFKNGLSELIKDEMNVKEVVFDQTIEEKVELDTNITPKLKKEGQFREFVRHIQDMRKKQKLTPSDFVTLLIDSSEESKTLMEEFMSELKASTPLKEVKFSSVSDGEEIQIDDLNFKVNISM